MKCILVKDQQVLLFGKDGSNCGIGIILLSLTDGKITNILNDLQKEIKDKVEPEFCYC